MRTNNLLAIATLAVIALFTACTSPAQKIVDIYQKAIEEMDRSSSELAPYIMEKAVDDADEIRRSDSYNPTDEERDAVAEAYNDFCTAYNRNLNKDFHKQMREKEQNAKCSEENVDESIYGYGGGVEEDDPELYENYGDDLDDINESGASAVETFVLFFAQGTLNLQDVNCVDGLMAEIERFGAFDKNAFTEQELTYPLAFDNRVEMADAVKNYFDTLMPIVKKYLGDMGADLQEAKQDMTEGIYEAKTISDLF